MESPNAVAGNKVPSSVLDKKGLNPDVNSLNSNNENPYTGLGTSGDYPKYESNLEVKDTSKAKDETPVIVLDPVNESSEGENIDESKPPRTDKAGEIPPLVQDPSQESDVQVVPPVEPGPEASEDEEYACKYCHRKFSNKQSLGGHQNAHKFERAMEKDAAAAASDAQESRAGYYSGTSVYPRMTSPALSSHHHPPGSLKRSYEYMNRPVLQISSGPYQSHQGIHVARPHNFHEFSQSAGWPARISRVSQFVTAQPPYLPTLHFPNQGGAASSSSSSRPVNSQVLSAFHESRSVPGRNAGVHNMKIVPGSEEDDSGLDLTLRL